VIFRGGEALLPLFLAAWFGRDTQTDLYYVLAAYFVFVAAILTGAFQDSGAVAVLVEVQGTTPDRFADIAGALLGHTLLVGCAAALGFGALAASVAGLTSPIFRVALELIAVMSLGVIATAVRAFYVGLLNARRLFRAHPVASGIGMAATWLVLLIGRGLLGVRIVPVAMLAGELVAISLLARVASRSVGAAIVPNLGRPEALRRIFSLVRLETMGSLITRINPLIDQMMAGLAGVVGGGTLLRYATEVAALPTSLLQATLFPVLLTRLAEQTRRPADFRATTRQALGAVVVLLAAAAGLLAAVRQPLCVLLFSHGAMDRAGVEHIAQVLPWALVGVAPFGALLVLARAHVARQNSRIMPSMGLLNSGLNACLNALFVGRLGLAGIALSTSVTYVIVAAVFWHRLQRAPDV
jgi:putative peptidoglycan lipid II flippase